MYSIQITHKKNFYSIRIRQQGVGKTKGCVFSMGYQVVNNEFIFDQNVKAINKIWPKENADIIAIGLLNFFAKTKKACSREWTAFWHIKDYNGNDKLYKMYDCSLKFIEKNYKLHLSL